MGLLDDILSQAAQGGNSPLMSALNALLVGTQGGVARRNRRPSPLPLWPMPAPAGSPAA